MFQNIPRFIGLIAMQVVLATFIVMLFSTASPSGILMKVNAVGAKGKEVLKNAASAAGRKVVNPIYTEVGEVDWSQGVIRATGYGVLPQEAHSYAQGQLLAFDAAQLDAERNLVATLAGLKIKARRHSDRHAIDEYDIEETVRAKLRGAEVVDVRNMPDGTVEVDMQVTLRKGNKTES